MPALPCATWISQKAAFLLTLKPPSSYLQTSPGREDKPHFPLTTGSRLGFFFLFLPFPFLIPPLFLKWEVKEVFPPSPASSQGAWVGIFLGKAL